MDFDVQADPIESANPSAFSLRSSISPSAPGKLAEITCGAAAETGPLTVKSGMHWRSLWLKYWRSSVNRWRSAALC